MKKSLTTGCRCACLILCITLILVQTPVTVKAVEIAISHQASEEKLKAAFYQYYTDEDIDLLARLMYAEVGVFLQTMDEEKAERAFMLTGSVVLNRCRSPKYGDDLEAVIYEKGQYQCVSNGSINNNPPEEVYKWAEELLQSGPIGPENMIFQSTKKQGTSTYDKIGNTYFCCKDL